MENYRRGMRAILTCLVALSLHVAPAQADYDAGRIAWEEGRHADGVSQWEAAAAAGDGRAMLALGRAYRRGIGVPQDYVEAHKWLNLAAGLGSVEAAGERDELAASMTADDQSAAMRLAREWRAGRDPAAAPRGQAAPSTDRPDDSGSDQPPKRALVKAQELLAQLGYAPGAADGVWGLRSARAYRNFLQDRGLPSARALTPAGLRALREAAGGLPEQATAAPRSPQPPPLHGAVRAGDVDGVNRLLETADAAAVNARDSRGWTPLMHAANQGYTLLVPPLLEAGAATDIRAPDGATALFMAALHGHADLIAILAEAGADPAVPGPQGRTAIDLMKDRYGSFHQARQAGESSTIVGLLRRDTTVPDVLALLDDEFVACGAFRFDSDYGHAKEGYAVDTAGAAAVRVLVRTTDPFGEATSRQFLLDPAEVDSVSVDNTPATPYGRPASGIQLHRIAIEDGTASADKSFYSCNGRSATAIARSLTLCFDDPVPDDSMRDRSLLLSKRDREILASHSGSDDDSCARILVGGKRIYRRIAPH